MDTMDNSLQEQQLRQRAAESDLGAARQHKQVGIAQTQQGLLNLSYEHNGHNGTYQLQRFDGSGVVLARGPKRVVLQTLMTVYVINLDEVEQND